MKRSFLFSALLFATVMLQAQVEPLPVDSAVRIGHLDNGLTYYIRHNEQPKQRAEFHIAQAVGAILEEDNQNGLAHFLEHMAFNGTEHYPGKGIINYFESIGVNFGGNINAYTSLDETVYRLSEVPTIRESIIDSALLVMHDWSHSLLLEGDEIDSERGVIREEWRTRASAERRMWSKLNPLTYPNSQYAKRDVIGDTAVINNFTYDALRDYYHKWYGPDLQAIIVVGDVDVDYVENKIKELWADVPERENRGERPLYSVDDNAEPIVAIVTDEEAQLTRIRVDYKKQQLPKELQQTNVSWLQDLINALITTMLDERFEELAQGAESPIVGGGSAYIELVKLKDSFLSLVVAKHGQEKAAYELLMTEMERLRRYGFTQAEYERAKQSLLSMYEQEYNDRNSRRNHALTQLYIRNFLDGEAIPSIDWEWEMIQQVLPVLPLEQINQVAQSYPTQENMIISFTAPEQEGVKLPSEKEIRALPQQLLTAEIAAPKEEVIETTLVKKSPKCGKVKKTVLNEELGTTELTLGNGVRVILKPTEFKQDEILMSAYSEGGLSLVDKATDLPSAMLATDIVDYSGLGEFDNIQLQKALTGKHVSVSTDISQYAETMGGNSSVKDFETMLQLVYLQFTAPRFDEQGFSTLTDLLATQLKNKAMNTKAVFRDSVSMMASNYSPRTVLWNTETLEKIDLKTAERVYKERFKNPADFTFTFTGNIDPTDKATLRLIAQWLGGLKTEKQAEHFQDRGIRPPKGEAKNYFDRQMQIKQTTNRIQFYAPMDYTLANDLNTEVIGRVLDMRYLESIREREGGSYGVGVYGYMQRRPVASANLLIQFDTDPEKEEKLMKIIYEEIEKIAEEGPLAVDLQKAKESMLKDFEEDLEKNNFWNRTILPNYYRWDVNYLTEYSEAVKQVNAETVKQTLKKLLEAGNVFEVVMSPQQ